ncbi:MULTISPECIES: DUF262 domain-containing protein [unclassified Roseibium]|uniref:DUF262 domain-containing protein n=1 Tax=unclassified Roseibium TaxID=2629323 RepID=UPI00273FA496|nr:MULTISPECIES: DUF262 domain-containing protein [unclassified Roseibium]
MTLNSLIQTTRPTVSSLVDGFRSGDYFVDNNFQRKLVWTEKQKVRLIETILIGFPMPEVYVWQQPADPETGKQRHSIVDGQQRISTMMQFVSNEWSLANRYLDHEDSEYCNCFWKDLKSETKRLFWDYVLNMRTIPSNITIDEIRSVFTRLNETDKSLNPQEIRNAEFNGEFINTAERIADMAEFKSMQVFSEHQIRRMADIEFTSSLLIFLRRGLVEENTKTVNEIYDLYNDVYEESDQDVSLVRGYFKKFIDVYFVDHSVRRLFTKPVHLFSLFCVEAMCRAQEVDMGRIPGKLSSFAEAYDNGVNPNSDIEQYREGASSRTRSRSSREKRITGLLSWIKGA